MNLNIYNKYFFFTIILLVIGTFSCTDKGTHPEDKEFVLPDKNVSFIEHIQPMFEAKCGFDAGCHSPTDTEQRFLYVELINRNGVIDHILTSTGEKLVNLPTDPKNPESAPLYLILKEGYPRVVDDMMPPPWLNREPLNENQLNGIKQWIKEGAPE